MVTLVEQATEMVKSKIKREREMAERKTFVPQGQCKKRLQIDPRGLLVTQKVLKINERPELLFSDSRCDLIRQDDLSPFTTLLSPSHHQIDPIENPKCHNL